MINTKIMAGKNVIDKLNFESIYSNAKSVLVITDVLGGFNCTKFKIKKALSKDIKINFIKIKDNNYASFENVDKCIAIANANNVDYIICVGSEIAINVGKAVNANLNKQLTCVITMEGNHQSILSSHYELNKEDSDILYVLSKSGAIPDIVMIDEKMLDKFGEIARRGMELGILIMSLLTIANVNDESKKLNSIAALGIIGKQESVSLVDLVTAEMFAGYDFIDMPKNVLHEFVLRGVRFTDVNYSLILSLIMKKSINKIVQAISDEDIKVLWNLYSINASDIEDWKEQLCKVIDNKIINYFVEKDIPSVINEIGLNSKEIERIAEEIFAIKQQNVEEEEIWLNNLSKIKDLVYGNFE